MKKKNSDPQSQPELDEINKLKEMVLLGCTKVQNIEMSERNSVPLKKEIPIRTNLQFQKVTLL